MVCRTEPAHWHGYVKWIGGVGNVEDIVLGNEGYMIKNYEGLLL
jgi:hypothetical protein